MQIILRRFTAIVFAFLFPFVAIAQLSFTEAARQHLRNKKQDHAHIRLSEKPVRTLSEMQVQAITKIEHLTKDLDQSCFYKNVSPEIFIAQLKQRVAEPYTLDQGKAYFCWAASPIASFYDHYPTAMAEAVIALYREGVFRFNGRNKELVFLAEESSREQVGAATFIAQEDSLSGRLVDQMVFLVFADHYKCWINVDRKFHPGDQSKSTWAGGTLRKEKRIWEDFGFDAKRRGNDIIWLRKNKANIILDQLHKHQLLVLYVNSARFNKKWDRLRSIKRNPPFIVTGSHYIILKELRLVNNEYHIVFWDDDGLQECTLDYDLFQRSVYGLVALDTIKTRY